MASPLPPSAPPAAATPCTCAAPKPPPTMAWERTRKRMRDSVMRAGGELVGGSQRPRACPTCHAHGLTQWHSCAEPDLHGFLVGLAAHGFEDDEDGHVTPAGWRVCGQSWAKNGQQWARSSSQGWAGLVRQAVWAARRMAILPVGRRELARPVRPATSVIASAVPSHGHAPSLLRLRPRSARPVPSHGHAPTPCFAIPGQQGLTGRVRLTPWRCA
jgi:hypothetical protein